MKKVCPICKADYRAGEVFCPTDAARLVTPSQMSSPSVEGADPLVGLRFDKYRIIERIGEGGMGLVYQAEHTVIEKRVAMKVLREDFSKRPEVVERFRQEAKSASRIGHENIVDISDFGTTPFGQSYFVMEMLDGEDLANVLARETFISSERAIDIVLQCCRALGAAHSKGIVHRDMKPENIFLTARSNGLGDFVKIVDFGIAKMSDIETPGEPGRKLTKTGMIFGTPEYMSPEQAAGKALDHRVDIYALGVILFEVTTGRVPFVGDSFMGILTQHMFEDPPSLAEVNPQVTVELELTAVIAKALSKDPDQRYATMADLADALLAARDGRVSQATLLGYGEPVKARPRPVRIVEPTGATEILPASPRRSGRGLLMAGALAVVAVGAALVYVFMRPEPTTAMVEDATPMVAPVATGAAPGDNHMDAVQEGAAAEADEAPGPVPVRIETQPEGAAVSVDGLPELGCEPTPCAIEVAAGETLTLRASRGRSRGLLEVTPLEATTVQIALTTPRARRVRRTGEDSSQGSPMGPNDLKVPSIFQ